MTGLRTISLLSLLLGALHIVSAGGDGDTNERRTFRYDDPETGERRRCVKCPPGTYVEAPCTSSEEDTVCTPCPEGHFAPTWNHYRQCAPCHKCAANLMTTPCTAIENSVCRCQDGFFWHDHTCKQHKKCPVGRGVVLKGSSTYNTVCLRCPEGTYSNLESALQPCLNFTNCLLLGRDVMEKGDRYRDNVCSEEVVMTTASPKKTTTVQVTTRQLSTKESIVDKVVTPTHHKSSQVNVPHKTAPQPHHPDVIDFEREEAEYFDEEELFDLEMEIEEEDIPGHEKPRGHRIENKPTYKHNIHEAGYDVQEINSTEHHDTSNGSGLAAGILGAGCLFLLVLIAVLYQRKKRLEEKQKLKELKQQPPEWQKLKQQGVSEENLTLLNKSRQASSDKVDEGETAS